MVEVLLRVMDGDSEELVSIKHVQGILMRDREDSDLGLTARTRNMTQRAVCILASGEACISQEVNF